MVRRPADDSTSSEPPSSFRTTGISAAASAWTIEPTVVPRLRIVACATWESAIASSGCVRRASTEASTSACRARAPTRTPSPVTVTSARPGSPLMSMSSDGAASLIDSNGTRLWPPASTLAFASPASAASASASDCGRR